MINKKKNVAVATWKGTYNYGTSLQSFALQYKLRLLGYNTFYLEHIPSQFSVKTRIKQWLEECGILHNIKHKSQTKKQKQIAKFHRLFYINKFVGSSKQFNKLLQETDVFVSGSDQIWNTYYRFDPFYFLEFASGKKKISYASSMATPQVNPEYKSRVREDLLDYNHISVRENSAVNVLSDLTGRKDIVSVLDPTFLLESSEWNDVVEKAEIGIELPEKFILCYFIGKNKHYEEQLEAVKNQVGIKDVIILPAKENPDFSFSKSIIYPDAGPMEFVKFIKEATYICTDSFHATALSINFNKPFVEFLRFPETDEKSQNSRIHDVLGMFKLEDRIYELSDGRWRNEMDFSMANMILREEREKSLSYLVSSIEN